MTFVIAWEGRKEGKLVSVCVGVIINRGGGHNTMYSLLQLGTGGGDLYDTPIERRKVVYIRTGSLLTF